MWWKRHSFQASGQHYIAFKDKDNRDDNRQTKAELKMIFTEAESFIGKHHTSSVIWKPEGKVWHKREKGERESLARTEKKAYTQWYPTFTKCPFYFFPYAGLFTAQNYFWDPDLLAKYHLQ